MPVGPPNAGQPDPPPENQWGSAQRPAPQPRDRNLGSSAANRHQPASSGGDERQQPGLGRGSNGPGRGRSGPGRGGFGSKRGGTSKGSGAKRAGSKAAGAVARKAAASATGGASEAALKGMQAARAAKQWVKVAVPAVFVLGALLMMVITTSSGGLGGALSNFAVPPSNDAMNSPAYEPNDSYQSAYEEAGLRWEVPWTVLAGIAKTTTDQGRVAASDVADYGSLLDREPSRAPLHVGAVSFSGKNAPAAGSVVTAVGDELLTEELVTNLSGSFVSYSFTGNGTAGVTAAEQAASVTGAVVQGADVVVVVAGSVDAASGSFDEEAIRSSIDAAFTAGGDADCVVWVTVPPRFVVENDEGTSVDTAEVAAFNVNAARFNSLLVEQADLFANASVADVASMFTSDAMVGADGVAVSSIGAAVSATTIAQQVSSCMPSSGETFAEAAGESTTTTVPDETVDADGTANNTDDDTVEEDGTADDAETAPTTTTTSTTTTTTVPLATAVVSSDPSYSTIRCDADRCGPYPLIGADDTAPQGPFALDPLFVAADPKQRDPHDIEDAADLLAEELDRIRDEMLTYSGTDFARYLSDPDDALALWQTVLANAPVIWPQGTKVLSECSATGAATLVWPLEGPRAVREFAETTSIRGTGVFFDLAIVGYGKVRAPGSGVVTGVEVDNGLMALTVDHYGRFTYRLGGLNPESVTVTEGAYLGAGAEVGTAPQGVTLRVVGADGAVDPRDHIVFAYQVEAGAPGNPQAGEPVTTTTAAPDVQGNPNLDPEEEAEQACAFAAAVAGASAGGVGVGSGLVIPVAGVAAEDLFNSWDFPRSGGRTHKGIDIMAEVGRPVIAAAPGVVQDRFGSGIKCRIVGHAEYNKPTKSVIVLGDDGRNYFYTHLHTILTTAGTRVEAGDLLGTVGETGNACGTPPHLHFSIDEGRATVTNPYPELVVGTSVAADSYSGVGLSAGPGLNGVDGPALATAYARFYGGLYGADPYSGELPSWAENAAVAGLGGSPTGLYPPGTLTEEGQAAYDRNPAVAEIIIRNFPPEQQDNALRIAACESSLNPTATSPPNSNDTTDYGLFQFNDGGTLQTYLRATGEDESNIARALDPEWSARAAFLLWEDRGWQPWSCSLLPKTQIVNCETWRGCPSPAPQGPGDTSTLYATVDVTSEVDES